MRIDLLTAVDMASTVTYTDHGAKDWFSEFISSASVVDLVHCTIQLLLICFHVAVTSFILIRMLQKNSSFTAPFYKLFLLHGISNYAAFTTVRFTNQNANDGGPAGSYCSDLASPGPVGYSGAEAYASFQLRPYSICH